MLVSKPNRVIKLGKNFNNHFAFLFSPNCKPGCYGRNWKKKKALKPIPAHDTTNKECPFYFKYRIVPFVWREPRYEGKYATGWQRRDRNRFPYKKMMRSIPESAKIAKVLCSTINKHQNSRDWRMIKLGLPMRSRRIWYY